MKKILQILAVFVTSCAFAQTSMLLTNISTNQTIAANGTFEQATTPNGTFAVVYNVTNTSAATHTYQAFRYNQVLNPGGAAASFCFAGGCYGPPGYSSNYLILNPGQSASDISGSYQMLSLDFEESPTIGYSHIKYSIKCIDSPNDSIQVNVMYNAPNGIKEINNSAIQLDIWPNPVSDQIALSIDNQKEFDGEVSLLNELGQIVKTLKVSKASIVSMNVRDLPRGIYFVRLQTKEGTVTKQISIN